MNFSVKGVEWLGPMNWIKWQHIYAYVEKKNLPQLYAWDWPSHIVCRIGGCCPCRRKEWRLERMHRPCRFTFGYLFWWASIQCTFFICMNMNFSYANLMYGVYSSFLISSRKLVCFSLVVIKTWFATSMARSIWLATWHGMVKQASR